jgi:hypothetical protein
MCLFFVEQYLSSVNILVKLLVYWSWEYVTVFEAIV